ncbi:MAG: hypothetical protein M3376_14115 [Actinomycetota bacterium]|nr:hypothetical protein [Actinomycetota bacterium]
MPFGYFNKDILMTRDLVPTEPKVQELKFFARGVGPLLSVHTDGNGGRAELVRYTPGKMANSGSPRRSRRRRSAPSPSPQTRKPPGERGLP